MSRFDLKLTDEEFGEITPLQFFHLMRRRYALMDEENLRAGTIAASIYNSKRTKEGQKVWDSSDFFTPLIPKIQSVRNDGMKEEDADLLGKVLALNTYYGGEDLREGSVS